MYLNRRESIRLLACGAFVRGSAYAAALASPGGFVFTKLDHVEINAPVAAASAAFFAKIFGGPVWKNNKTERRYVMLGPCYLAIEQGREPLGVDHFSAGIQDFQIAAVHDYLSRSGIEYRDFPSGRDLNIADPDGIRIQLSADNTWSQLADTTASPEAVTPESRSIFQPFGLDHIRLNVSNLAQSIAFYSRIFGAPLQTPAGAPASFAVGTSRIELARAASRTRPGVHHFCALVRPFTGREVATRLKEAGAVIEQARPAASPCFRDANGLLVEVASQSATPIARASGRIRR